MSNFKGRVKNQLKNIARQLTFSYLQQNPSPLKHVYQVHLHVTDDCVLRCKMCNIWKIDKRLRQRPLTFSAAKIMIDKIFNWSPNFFLVFTGGETFLNPDLTKIIHYTHDKGIKTSTNTNGVIINEHLAKIISQSGIDTICVSIDGTAAKHDYVRGVKGSFDKALQAIKLLNQYRNKKTNLYLNTVVSANNLQQLAQLVHLAKKIKVDGIKFQALMPNFATSYSTDWFKGNKLWVNNKKQLQQAIQKLKLLKKEYGPFILNDNADFERMLNYFSDPIAYSRDSNCLAGLDSIMVATNGDVRLCHETAKIGNLLQDDPQTIWQSRVAAQRREQILACQRPCRLLPCNDIYYSYLAEAKQRVKDLLVTTH